jgi:predicted ferric reductase
VAHEATEMDEEVARQAGVRDVEAHQGAGSVHDIAVARTRLTRAGWLIAGTLFLTTGLWIVGRFDELIGTGLWPWRGLSQLVMLWSAALAMLSILAVVRARALEPLFRGLGEAVRLHRRMGLAALLGLVVHGLLLAADAASRGAPVAAVLVPFYTLDQRAFDILAWYVLIGLGVLAYDRRLRHERWLALHRVIGLLFVVGTLHAAIEPGTIRAFEPLRTWIVILLLVGALAWSYRVFLFPRMGPRYCYQVDSVTPRGAHTIDLELRPVDQRMMYEPGTFAFIRVPRFAGKAGELHPFSISSSPLNRNLRFSIQQIGDFTRQLSYLSLGEDNPDYWKARRPGRWHPVSTLTRADVDVYGPFGSFTPHRFQQYRRMVWIGAGIGITPFLSMLAFEHGTRDLRRIRLYYLVHAAQDGVYDAEIQAHGSRADFSVDYTLWATSERGHLTATQVVAEQGGGSYAVMLCGSMAFIGELARQFRELGFPRERIIAEELQFRS